MLILTRKQGESFLLGEKIEISISEVNGDRVRIAIDAPKEVKILRKELKDASDLNIEAASVNKIPSSKDLSALVNLAETIKKTSK